MGTEEIATVSGVAEATESAGDRDRLTTAQEAPVVTRRTHIHPAATIAPGNARIVTRAVGMTEIGNGTVETDDAILDAMMTTEYLPGAKETCSMTDHAIAIAIVAAGEKGDGRLVLHRGRGSLLQI